MERDMRDRMLAVCRRFAEAAPAEAMIREPYLPYVPANWNGVLVLAEAQQLAGPKQYHELLRGLSAEQRMDRLSLPYPSGIGVGPWDDGTAKLALKAMMPELDLSQVAVGNAVPWSCRTESGTNANPTEAMWRQAAAFWRELLDVWRPEFRPLILLGKVAARVLDDAGARNAVKLRLPSPNNIQRICGMFDQDDLLARYPEVGVAGAELGISLNPSNVFFACHAVSLGHRQMRPANGGRA